ncbi:MAG: hypothetical protein JSY10_17735 [Paenibacillus sp.]|nr:hypothetical protein [Paenibacillus sp.]
MGEEKLFVRSPQKKKIQLLINLFLNYFLFLFLFLFLFFHTRTQTASRKMRNYTEDEMQRMRVTLNGETGLDKIKRKAREEPFVPAGKKKKRNSSCKKKI